MDNNEKQIQKRLFQKLDSLFPKSEYILELSKLLGKSPHTIYRLKNGSTDLKVNQLYQIGNHFSISIDELLFEEEQRNILFQFNNFHSATPEPYLRFVSEQFYGFQKINAKDKIEMVIASKEIPSFYFFLYPVLLAYRSYYYARVLWASEYFQNFPFDVTKIDNLKQEIGKTQTMIEGNAKNVDIFELGKEIAQAFTNIETTEIWNDDTVSGHLNMLLYGLESNFFASKKSALAMLEATEKMLEDIETNANNGYKSFAPNTKGGRFTMYYTESLPLDSTIVKYINEELYSAYFIYNTGNYLISKNKNFVLNIEAYNQKIMAQSYRISKAGKKKRQQLFERNYKKLDKFSIKINKHFS